MESKIKISQFIIIFFLFSLSKNAFSNSYYYNIYVDDIKTNSYFDSNGFDVNGINKDTGTKYDLNGYDVDGYDVFGYNYDGINIDGYQRPNTVTASVERIDMGGYYYCTGNKSYSTKNFGNGESYYEFVGSGCTQALTKYTFNFASYIKLKKIILKDFVQDNGVSSSVYFSGECGVSGTYYATSVIRDIIIDIPDGNYFKSCTLNTTMTRPSNSCTNCKMTFKLFSF